MAPRSPPLSNCGPLKRTDGVSQPHGADDSHTTADADHLPVVAAGATEAILEEEVHYDLHEEEQDAKSYPFPNHHHHEEAQRSERDYPTGINVLANTYKDTGLSVRSDEYSVPTSTFDYLYEFSETRKVLEEFFKCPTFELDDEKFADKLSDSEGDNAADIRYDFVRDSSKKSPIRCSIENLDSGSPTGHLNADQQQQHQDTDEAANEADVEDEGTHDEPRMNHRHRTFDLSISSLARQSPELVMNNYHHHLLSHQNKSNNRTTTDTGEDKKESQSSNQYFRYSPETTDYDSNCGDLDSLSGDFNGPQSVASHQAYMRQCYASMPVLEDGLSSGHASDAENNNHARARIRNNGPSPNRELPHPNASIPKATSPFAVAVPPAVGHVTPNHHFLQQLSPENYFLNATNKPSTHTCLGNVALDSELSDRTVAGENEVVDGGHLQSLEFGGNNANSKMSYGANCNSYDDQLTANGMELHQTLDQHNKSPFRSSTTSPVNKDRTSQSLNDGHKRALNINAKIFKNTDPDLESLYSINKFQSNGKRGERYSFPQMPTAD